MALQTLSAVIKSCSADREKRKSHTPLSPCSGATVKSTPENRLTGQGACVSTSASSGAIMNSERAFSV